MKVIINIAENIFFCCHLEKQLGLIILEILKLIYIAGYILQPYSCTRKSDHLDTSKSVKWWFFFFFNLLWIIVITLLFHTSEVHSASIPQLGYKENFGVAKGPFSGGSFGVCVPLRTRNVQFPWYNVPRKIVYCSLQKRSYKK